MGKKRTVTISVNSMIYETWRKKFVYFNLSKKVEQMLREDIDRVD